MRNWLIRKLGGFTQGEWGRKSIDVQSAMYNESQAFNKGRIHQIERDRLVLQDLHKTSQTGCRMVTKIYTAMKNMRTDALQIESNGIKAGKVYWLKSE